MSHRQDDERKGKQGVSLNYHGTPELLPPYEGHPGCPRISNELGVLDQQLGTNLHPPVPCLTPVPPTVPEHLGVHGHGDQDKGGKIVHLDHRPPGNTPRRKMSRSRPRRSERAEPRPWPPDRSMARQTKVNTGPPDQHTHFSVVHQAPPPPAPLSRCQDAWTPGRCHVLRRRGRG